MLINSVPAKVELAAIAALDLLAVIDEGGSEHCMDIAIRNIRERCTAAFPEAFGPDGKRKKIQAPARSGRMWRGIRR